MLEALALAEADDVEPVPRPALAVMGRGEQAVDQPLVGVGVRVGDERLDLLGRRRQAEQVEGEPADQRAAVGLGRRIAGRPPPSLRQDESVDRLDRRRCRHRSSGGWRRGGDRLQRPPVVARPQCRCRSAKRVDRLVPQSAPAAIHLRSVSFSAGQGGLGGISPASTRSQSRLSSGLPGDENDPLLPTGPGWPSGGQVSPPFLSVALWQPRQRLASSGAIVRSNQTAAAATPGRLRPGPGRVPSHR